MNVAKLTVMAAIIGVLGGCSTVQTVDGSCRIFKPISNSKADTIQTRREVVAHNKVYGAICKG